MKTPSKLRIPREQKIVEVLELADLGKKARLIFHDIANQITAISLSIAHIEENIKTSDEGLTEYQKRAEKARVQIEYVADMLRCHLKDPTTEIFRPQSITQEIAEVFSGHFRLHNIRFTLTCPRSLEIVGSKSAFIHVITNLISNSIDSFLSLGRDRKRTILIAVSQTASYITLSVSDNGCGIKNADIKNVFKQNFTTKKHGHGIGLSASKEYLQKEFGGKIRVKSSSAGTKFNIRIPTPRTQPKQNRRHIMSPVLLPKNGLNELQAY